MEEWNVYYNDGLAYCKTVMGAKDKGKKFGNAVMYNLIGLSLESMLTALIMKDGSLPEHSSIGNMLRLLKAKHDVPVSFTEESRFYNKFMNMCSLDVFASNDPDDEDIERMISFMVNVRSWVKGQVDSVDVNF